MRSIHTLEPVLKAVEKLPTGGVLVLDVDETILHSGDGIGSDSWYDARIKESVALGMELAAAVLESNDAWEKMQPGLPVFLTEPRLLTILKVVAEKGRATLGLTARRPEMAAGTQTQFSTIGVDLVSSRWLKEDVTVSEIARYIDGVLYGGPLVDKGSLLFDFFSKVGHLPAAIIFADDKQYHIESMEKLCAANQIPCTAFHYLRNGRP